MRPLAWRGARVEPPTVGGSFCPLSLAFRRLSRRNLFSAARGRLRLEGENNNKFELLPLLATRTLAFSPFALGVCARHVRAKSSLLKHAISSVSRRALNIRHGSGAAGVEPKTSWQRGRTLFVVAKQNSSFSAERTCRASWATKGVRASSTMLSPTGRDNRQLNLARCCRRRGGHSNIAAIQSLFRRARSQSVLSTLPDRLNRRVVGPFWWMGVRAGSSDIDHEPSWPQPQLHAH